jgi:hypothetical protein
MRKHARGEARIAGVTTPTQADQQVQPQQQSVAGFDQPPPRSLPHVPHHHASSGVAVDASALGIGLAIVALAAVAGLMFLHSRKRPDCKHLSPQLRQPIAASQPRAALPCLMMVGMCGATVSDT